MNNVLTYVEKMQSSTWSSIGSLYFCSDLQSKGYATPPHNGDDNTSLSLHERIPNSIIPQRYD